MFDIFSCACWPFVCLVWRTVYASPLCISKIGLLFYWVVKILDIFWIKTLIRYIMCLYFLPFCGLSFYFLDSLFWCTKVCNFEELQIICFFFFHCLCFSVRSKKLLLNAGSWIPWFIPEYRHPSVSTGLGFRSGVWVRSGVSVMGQGLRVRVEGLGFWG